MVFCEVFALIALAAFSASAAAADDARVKATVSANLAHDAGTISPLIYGQFLEHFHRIVYGGVYDPQSPLADKNGFRQDVIEAMRRIHVPILRWPGGCFASAYHWRDGVGENRSSTYDKAWRMEDPNTFGTNEFITFCREVGAEPYVCGNAGTGTPEELSDWVEYCNLSIGS
jgi:alpha-N-arabinofuranosidase